METKFDYANDIGKQNARMFEEAFKPRKQIGKQYVISI